MAATHPDRRPVPGRSVAETIVPALSTSRALCGVAGALLAAFLVALPAVAHQPLPL